MLVEREREIAAEEGRCCDVYKDQKIMIMM